MKTYISILLTAVAAALAVELNKSLVDAGIGTRTSVVVSVVLSVFTLEIARSLLTELPMRLRLTRRLLDPIAKFEGLYVEMFESLFQRPVSVGVVEYNRQSKKYIYTGCAFDGEGCLRAVWDALDVVAHPGENMFYHFFSGQLYGETSEDIRGYGVLDFNTATGYFVDSGTDLKKHHFRFQRLRRKDYHNLTGSYRRPKQDFWQTIAKAFLEKPE